MKNIYGRLAFTGICKNRRIYFPYFLSCVGMILIYYVMAALSRADCLIMAKAGDITAQILKLGSYVILLFSFLFLLYTNSFLMKQRKKEFGLYHILGMEKRHIGWILVWEHAGMAFASLFCGILAGILFEKLAELALQNLVFSSVSYSVQISKAAMVQTVLLFLPLFVFLLLYSIWQVHRTSPLELLKSRQEGEKPPRANWLLGLVGFVILGIAYDMAVTIKNPIRAIEVFFVAVLLVILATYLIFIAGSVLICRILKAKKSYYYRPNHFVSVSSMAYRMKRNGAGLASICILATGVLVMMASSSSLYFGVEDSLRERYYRDININFKLKSDLDTVLENRDAWKEQIACTAAEYGDVQKDVLEYINADTYGYLQDGVFYADSSNAALSKLDKLVGLVFFSEEEYNRNHAEPLSLKEGEIYLSCPRIEYEEDTLTLPNGKTLSVAEKNGEPLLNGYWSSNICPTIYIVTPDYEDLVHELSEQKDSFGVSLMSVSWYYGFNTDLPSGLENQLLEKLDAGEGVLQGFLVEGLEENRAEFYMLYGGLFFIGIMLSIVFIAGTVLIIFYKQISEGYEDEEKFEIMQKVGMTKKEIRKSIYSQMRLVFFLPLAMAVVHLAFAFPVIQKMLLLFNLTNVSLFLETIGVSVILFSALYLLVYRITSREYYKIVSK